MGLAYTDSQAIWGNLCNASARLAYLPDTIQLLSITKNTQTSTQDTRPNQTKFSLAPARGGRVTLWASQLP